MNSNPFSLEGKKILVTGASSGIGREICCQLNNLGASVNLTGRSLDKLQVTEKKLKFSESTKLFVGNLTEDVFLTELVSTIDKLDGVVLNAGMMKLVPLKSMTNDIIDDMVSINYLSQVKLVRELFKQRKINKRTSIVFITSINGGVIGSKANALYGSTKAALTGLARALAIDLGPKSIRVNCIAPGMIETEGAEEVFDTVSKESIEKDKLKYPLRCYGEPRDVALAAAYLLSDASKWVTGTTLVVDGGFTAQ